MKSRWKNQYAVIESASKFHNKVREILATDSYFKRLRCFQEVPVIDLIPDYYASNQHYDWYIEELETIIELHGMQHYQCVNYGNIGYELAQKNFYNIQQRDIDKKEYAIEAGYKFVEIPYKHYNKLDRSSLAGFIFS